MTIAELVNRYYDWLRDRTQLRELGEWVEITTPYLDRHNDFIQMYARMDGKSVVLSDDGWTLNDLAMEGCEIDSPRRTALLKMVLNGLGVRLAGNALEVTASQEPTSFAQKKHNLVQAMLAVNDLFYVSRPMVASLFFEDVAHWLEDIGARYSPRVKFPGKSGFDNYVDFLIPSSKAKPERLVNVVTDPDRSRVVSVAFGWMDIRDARHGALAYAVLNDQEKRIPRAVLDAFRNYEIHPIPWSQRTEFVDDLAA